MTQDVHTSTRFKILILSTLGSLAACAAEPPPTPVASIDRQKAQQYEQLKQEASAIPAWYLKPPADDQVTYAVGVASSADLSLATDKAILDAKRGLADQVAGKLSNNTRHYVKETADGKAANSDFERTTANVVVDTALPGYSVQERAIQPANGAFRVYVLLRFQGDNTDLNHRIEASKAFKDLNDKVEKATRVAETKTTQVIPNAVMPAGVAPLPPEEPEEPVQDGMLHHHEGKPSEHRNEEPPLPRAAPRPAVQLEF